MKGFSECKKLWYDSDLYHFDENTTRDDVYSIDTPPPTISGVLHMGHVFSYCHTDFIARYQRINGKNVFYPIGFDDNGLPTERLTEKIMTDRARKEGQSYVRGVVMSREKSSRTISGKTYFGFADMCQEITQEHEKEFEHLFKMLGLSFDWTRKYETISDKSAGVAYQSFADLFYKGCAYMATSPVYWDCVDQTALAQADIEIKDIPGTEYNIIFDVSKSFSSTDCTSTSDIHSVEIMTTRPELLSACVALLVHPDDSRYNGKLLGESCEIVRVDGSKICVIGLKIHGNTQGNQFFARTPLGKIVPIIPHRDVSYDKGTGIVMCCTYGDMQDVAWIKDFIHWIPTDEMCDLNERHVNSFTRKQALLVCANGFSNGCTFGLDEVKKDIINFLGCNYNHNNRQFLVCQNDIVHPVKCAERSGRQVEILAIPQWYVSFGFNGSGNQSGKSLNTFLSKPSIANDGFVGNRFQCDMLNLSDMLNFFPNKMKIRLKDWIKGLNQDWCISRGRFSGVDIPILSGTEMEKSSSEVIDQSGDRCSLEISQDSVFEKQFQPAFDYLTKKCSDDRFCVAFLDEKWGSVDNDYKRPSGSYVLPEEQRFVFDTWFISSVSPQLNTGLCSLKKDIIDAFGVDSDLYNKLYPFDLRPQAHEIIRTWTFYTLAKAYLHSLCYSESASDWYVDCDGSGRVPKTDEERLFAMKSILPWRDVVLSGWCLARDKTKMSKSKGNVVEPLPLLEKYGVDAVRYWTSTANVGVDTPYNEESLRDGKRLVQKLGNVGKFLSKYNDVYTLNDNSIINDLNNGSISDVLDKFMLSRLDSIVCQYREYFEACDYCRARELVERFFWNDFCNDYLEIVKGRVYGKTGFAFQAFLKHSVLDDSLVDKMTLSALVTLHHIFKAIIILFSPFLPYVTEDLFQSYYALFQPFISVHERGILSDLVLSLSGIKDILLDIDFDDVRFMLHAVAIVRKWKTSQSLSMKAEIYRIVLNKPIGLCNFDFRSVCNAFDATIEVDQSRNDILIS